MYQHTCSWLYSRNRHGSILEYLACGRIAGCQEKWNTSWRRGYWLNSYPNFPSIVGRLDKSSLLHRSSNPDCLGLGHKWSLETMTTTSLSRHMMDREIDPLNSLRRQSNIVCYWDPDYRNSFSNEARPLLCQLHTMGKWTTAFQCNRPSRNSSVPHLGLDCKWNFQAPLFQFDCSNWYRIVHMSCWHCFEYNSRLHQSSIRLYYTNQNQEIWIACLAITQMNTHLWFALIIKWHCVDRWHQLASWTDSGIEAIVVVVTAFVSSVKKIVADKVSKPHDWWVIMWFSTHQTGRAYFFNCITIAKVKTTIYIVILVIAEVVPKVDIVFACRATEAYSFTIWSIKAAFFVEKVSVTQSIFQLTMMLNRTSVANCCIAITKVKATISIVQFLVALVIGNHCLPCKTVVILLARSAPTIAEIVAAIPQIQCRITKSIAQPTMDSFQMSGAAWTLTCWARTVTSIKAALLNFQVLLTNAILNKTLHTCPGIEKSTATNVADIAPVTVSTIKAVPRIIYFCITITIPDRASCKIISQQWLMITAFSMSKYELPNSL